MTWNLLRGGIAVTENSQISTNVISEYIQQIKEESGIAFEVCSKIKSTAPIFETKLPPQIALRFSDEMKKQWEYISRLSMICLMYHSDILKEMFNQYDASQAAPADSTKSEEMMKIVWKHSLSICKWMQNSLNGEKETHILIKESLKIVEKLIKDKKDSIFKKWTENKEKERKNKLEQEERERKAKQDEEEKAKAKELEQPDLKKKSTSSINQKVSVSKVSNKSKKSNRKKLINQINVPSSKKKAKDENTDKKPEEEKKEIVEEDNKEQAEEKPPAITDKELNALMSQIYNDVYAFFISKLKEDTLLKTL